MKFSIGPFRFRSRKLGRVQEWMERNVEPRIPRSVKNRLFIRKKARTASTVGREAGAAGSRGSRDQSPIEVALLVSGGLGDLLVIARFFRDFLATCEDIKFTVFCSKPSQATFAFSGLPGYEEARDEPFSRIDLRARDLTIVANQTVRYHGDEANWAKIAKAPRLTEILRAIDGFTRRQQLNLFSDNHPYFDGFMARRAVFMNAGRRDFLHRIAGIEYGGDAFPVPSQAYQSAWSGQPFVTVHNGYDTSVSIKGGSGRHTKCWPHFDDLVRQLKDEFPALAIVQLGSSTSKPLSGVDANLIDQTTFPEVADILARSALHFDNESGLVHLASALGTQSVVMFGPTPADFFSYPANINVAPEFCGGCWWIVPDWRDACTRGFDTPLCLSRTSATRVLDLVRPKLQALVAGGAS